MTLVWTVAATCLLLGLAVCAVAVGRGNATERTVAFQVASSVAGCLVVALAGALDEPIYLDLALALVLLSLVGTLSFTRFLERWL